MQDREFVPRAGPYAVPYSGIGSMLGQPELAAIEEVLRSADSLSNGIFRDRFEAAFREHVGVNHAISVTSGTVALQLAIHLLDLQPGDEVITTPQTYQATIQPLLDRDVRVRFADTGVRSPNIDPAQMAKLVTDRTRAIILVHYGGLPVDMEPVMRLAGECELTVIEDAAHALGSAYHGRRPGGIGHIGCFSFHSSKNITTLGEGGMITLNRDDWAERLHRLRSNEADMVLVGRPHRFGSSASAPPRSLYPGAAYTHDCLAVRRAGTNATLSEPAAAVGLVQLGHLPALVARRQMIAARISAELAGISGVHLPAEPADTVHSYHLFTFFVDAGTFDRDELIRCLDLQGVQTYLRYFPLHLLPEWRAKGHHLGECPVAEQSWFSEHVNLPCQPGMSDGQVEALVATLSKALAKVRRSLTRGGAVRRKIRA
ncbi:MAG TPA: DegT/DnrJ/EryC1/StrS family aminotransferase [Streptosporangiaceae bacterium]|nr:DegT/DnrJ/EryC1/StrS family aminotransferase [Streptosporangiaceae bacterium]